LTTWRCLATVLRVIDGDTFACDFDLGWGNWMHEVKGRPNRVRILGLDTPERGQPGYAEAGAELEALLGERVWVTSVKLDSFGRTLADVTTMEGVDVRGAMRQEWWV
jgi:endonuclease YncB( thermonuclease family)